MSQKYSAFSRTPKNASALAVVNNSLTGIAAATCAALTAIALVALAHVPSTTVAAPTHPAADTATVVAAAAPQAEVAAAPAVAVVDAPAHPSATAVAPATPAPAPAAPAAPAPNTPVASTTTAPATTQAPATTAPEAAPAAPVAAQSLSASTSTIEATANATTVSAPTVSWAGGAKITLAPADPTKAGVPAGTVLTRHDGDIYVTTPGAVLDSLDVYGKVIIQANNVTIKNSIVRGMANPTYTAPSIDNNRGFTGLTVTDSTITAQVDTYYAAMGIVG
ncbi:MAG TPA: hypothetical protein VFU07_06345, partial [Candidatus Lumbricidophila sp.]|nr:hypothetical protein [Candidatus Lumbricidophila sp.]